MCPPRFRTLLTCLAVTGNCAVVVVSVVCTQTQYDNTLPPSVQIDLSSLVGYNKQTNAVTHSTKQNVKHYCRAQLVSVVQFPYREPVIITVPISTVLIN